MENLDSNKDGELSKDEFKEYVVMMVKKTIEYEKAHA